MQAIAAGGDAATEALIEQQKAQRELGMALSQTTTKLLAESDGLISSVTTLTKGATFIVDQVNQGIGATSGTNTRPPGQTSNGNTNAPDTTTAGQSMGFFTGIGQGVDNFFGNETISDPATTATQPGTSVNPVPTDMTPVVTALREVVKQQKITNNHMSTMAMT